jgi:hypothetical protein
MRKKPVGRKGLQGREAAAPAAEPPESPVFAKQKCARMIMVFILEPTHVIDNFYVRVVRG